MDEGDAGGRVIADAAMLLDQRGVAQNLYGNVREGDVGGLAEDMLAAFCLPPAFLPQRFVGLGRAKAADEMDRLVRAELLMQRPDQVDQSGVHTDFFVGPPIAHEMIELLERSIVILAVTLEGDGEVFLGVDVVHGKGARLAQRSRPIGSRRAPRGSGKKHETCAEHGATYDTPPNSHPQLTPFPRRPSRCRLPRRCGPLGHARGQHPFHAVR